jgi:hypothetical protein
MNGGKKGERVKKIRIKTIAAQSRPNQVSKITNEEAEARVALQ